MGEFKKEYLNELNMILTCNVSDKIAPLLREQNEALFNKTTAMLQLLIPKTDDFITKSIENIVSQFQENVNNDTQQMLAKAMDKETLFNTLMI